MVEKQKCGKHYIFEDKSGWWIVEEIESGVILGKFKTRNDALEKLAHTFQDDEDRTETESVC